MDEFARAYGIEMAHNWQERLSLYADQLKELERVFHDLDRDKDGRLTGSEIKALACKFFDGREPSDKQLAGLMSRLDKNGDGSLDLQEMKEGVTALSCWLHEKNDQD